MKRMHTDREIRSLAVNSVEKKEDLEIFENIVDKDGHKRFIEGELNFAAVEGVTKEYTRWSLSGSHLMAVMCLKIDDETSLSFDQIHANFISLPSWIYSKVVTLAPDSDSVMASEFKAYNADCTSNQACEVFLRKGADNLFITIGSFTATADRYVRIQFDLLIDNE